MLQTTDSNSSNVKATPTAASVLLNNQDQVISAWMQRAKVEVDQACELDQSVLINAVPKLVMYIASALEAGDANSVKSECAEFGKFHGGERAKISDYNPDELVQEYYIFCEVLCELLVRSVKLTLGEYHIIHKVVSMALRESMASYSDAQVEFRERFIATLAHDLRNPIGVARTAAELISLECHNAEEVCFLAERLMTNLKRADDLMQSLLDVAYMHSGYELNYQMERCDLKQIIIEVVQSASLTHGNRFQIFGESVDGFWNTSALRRSLENLLSNAIKYGDYDKPVVIDFKHNDHEAEIKVHNDGRAIPPADQKRIFQPFKREKSIIESKPGHGLGLCFVQTAAEAHGGRVEVHSDENHGTDFIIYLPLDSRH